MTPSSPRAIDLLKAGMTDLRRHWELAMLLIGLKLVADYLLLAFFPPVQPDRVNETSQDVEQTLALAQEAVFGAAPFLLIEFLLLPVLAVIWVRALSLGPASVLQDGGGMFAKRVGFALLRWVQTMALGLVAAAVLSIMALPLMPLAGGQILTMAFLLCGFWLALVLQTTGYMVMASAAMDLNLPVIRAAKSALTRRRPLVGVVGLCLLIPVLFAAFLPTRAALSAIMLQSAVAEAGSLIAIAATVASLPLTKHFDLHPGGNSDSSLD